MTLSERDQHTIWHPYTQHKISSWPIPITRGEGAYLIDESGKRYLDLVSSWFVNLHGHAEPTIAKAIYDQALKLEQVIFSGFTHEPAVQLADELLAILPKGFSKIFYSDNGSTAVEVALKMAYQYWRNRGEMKRQRFIAFDGAYHGDTFGAMAVGKNCGFFGNFDPLLFEVKMFPYPTTWLNDNTIEEKENAILQEIKTYLENFHDEVAALIIEPLIQGSSGMRMCRPEFLRALQRLLQEYGILQIYDEVMTGFGRTGDLFASLKSNTTPDIICLAKGLTGGFLPLAATVCNEKIYETFLGDDFKKALAHGHSYTANPLGCAAALASLKLLKSTETLEKIAMIERVHRERLANLEEFPLIKHRRFCGTIAAFDLNCLAEYGSKESVQLRKQFLERGLLIRPLGNVIYLMPPYCITERELQNTYDIVIHEVEGAIA